MNVKLRLVGFPALRQRLASDEVNVDLEGSTVGQLVEWLQIVHGDPSGVRLRNREGRMDPAVQVIRNGREWLSPDRADAILSEGDEITFFVLVAGG